MTWMWGGAILYLVLLLTTGVLTLRHGHVWMFVVGLFVPLFWLIGAIVPPPRRYR